MILNFRVFFVADGNETFNDEAHNATLSAMAPTFSDVVDTDTMVGIIADASVTAIQPVMAQRLHRAVRGRREWPRTPNRCRRLDDIDAVNTWIDFSRRGRRAYSRHSRPSWSCASAGALDRHDRVGPADRAPHSQ